MKIINQIVAVIFVAVFMLGISSCENANSSSSNNSQSKISSSELFERLNWENIDKKFDEKAVLGDDLFDKNCEKLYNIELSALSDGGIICSDNGGFADEISVLKANSITEEELTELLKQRVQRRIKDFTGYKPQEIEKIENSHVFVCGGFAILIISDDAEKLEQQIKEILSE